MILLDANIVLEVLLPNRAKQEKVAKLLLGLDSPTCITMLTVHLVFHFGRISQIPDELLQQAIDLHTVVALVPEDYQWARNHEQGRDFEDALQVAAAVRSGCSSFVTLDHPLAKRYASVITCIEP